MKRLVLLLAAVIFVPEDEAAAAVFCVADGNALQAALDMAESNGQNDEIRLRGGVYSRVADDSAFVYGTAENFGLALSGGWNAGCTNFRYDTQFSVLDGGDARRVMLLQRFVGGNNIVIFSFSRLQFQNGMASSDGGGLKIFSAANNVELLVRHCTFVANVAGTIGGGLSASATSMQIHNSLFLANDASVNYGAANLTSFDGAAHVVNNTIFANDSPLFGGLRFVGGSPLELANNILWANTVLDLDVQTVSHSRYHNNIGILSAPEPDVLIGEIDTAPEFQAGLLNFNPLPFGALFNSGYPSPTGGLASTDLLGRPRVSAGRVDIGAYEVDVLFYDGFDP